MIRTRIAVAGILLAGATALAACSSGSSTSTSSTTAATTTTTSTTSATTPPPEVKALYSTNCSACHGDKRQGVSGLGPALTPQRLAGRADTDLRDIIAKGKTGTAMSAWTGRLTSQQIDALVTFIKTVAP